MYNRLLLLAVLVCLTGLGHNTSVFAHNPTSSTQTPPCFLPAPANFQVTNVGTNSADLQWDPVTGAAAYVIETFNLDYPWMTVPIVIVSGAATTATVTGLTQSCDYSANIYACCATPAAQNMSRYFGTVGFGVIVIDLIMHAPAPPQNCSPDCTIDLSGDSCQLANSPDVLTYFKLVNPYNRSSTFAAFQTDAQGKHHLQLQRVGENNLNDDQVAWYFSQGGAAPPALEIDHIKAKYPNSEWLLCDIYLDQAGVTAPAWLRVKNLASGYTLYRLGCASSNNPEDRSASPSSAALPVAVNPFSDRLEVRFESPAETDVVLDLYDTGGRKVGARSFEAGSDFYSMPTSSLSPGLYLLRITAKNSVTTLKVVKNP